MALTTFYSTGDTYLAASVNWVNGIIATEFFYDINTSGNITTITEVVSGSTITSTLTYNDNNLVDNISETRDSKTITTTYVYDSGGAQLNNCETTGDWTAGGQAAAAASNSTTYWEGAGAIDLRKSGTAGTSSTWTDTVTSFDVSGADDEIIWKLKIKDATALAKLETEANAGVRILLSDDGFTSWIAFNVGGSDTSRVGWNLLRAQTLGSPDANNGTVALAAVTGIRIELTTTANADTFTTDDIIMDDVRYRDDDDQEGQVMKVTRTVA